MPAIKFYDHEPIPMEMHKVKIVQQLNLLPADQRLSKMRKAGFNTFRLHNGDIFMDMLTDSGVNAMSDEMQAAILSVKLRPLDDDNHRRQAIANYYYDHISNPLITLPTRLPDPHNVYHIFPVFSDHRDELQAYLSEQAIQTLIHYPIPPHQQQCYSEWSHLSLPVTERIHQTELSIPISPVMSDGDVQAVVEALNSFHR